MDPLRLVDARSQLQKAVGAAAKSELKKTFERVTAVGAPAGDGDKNSGFSLSQVFTQLCSQ